MSFQCQWSPTSFFGSLCLLINLPVITIAFVSYRPQQVAKVMFLQVSLCPRGGGGGAIPACLAAGLQEGGGYSSMPCRFPGPHPRGKFRGICPGEGEGISRPTPKGKVEGDQVQAHSQGGSEGDPVQAHSQGGSWRGSAQGGLPGLGGPPGPREVETPPSRRLLLRTVRILLECILVYNADNIPSWSFKSKKSATTELQWNFLLFYWRNKFKFSESYTESVYFNIYIVFMQMSFLNDWTSTLWHARIFNMGFNHCNAVIFQIVVKIDMTHSVMFIWWFMNSLFVPPVKPQYLHKT